MPIHKIHFKEPPVPIASRAKMYDVNGNGVPDSLVIPFNKAFEDVLKSILVGYIQSKRCCLPFNEEFACRRLSLKSWPKEYINGFIPKDFRVQQSYLEQIARMVSVHVTANFLTQPHPVAA